MILILGNSTDVFVLETLLRCNDAGLGRDQVMACDEKTLLESVPFALQIDHACRGGYLDIGGRHLAFKEIDAVVFRPQRWWWPSEDFNLKDQMFVYHETMASWFAILNALPCAVVNRFGLGWWLQDLNYPRQLAAGLADALDLACGVVAIDENSSYGRILPMPRPGDLDSMYIAGCRLLPTSGCPASLRSRVAERQTAIGEWQRETGISMFRADFTREASPRLRYVEAFPLLEGEDPALAASLSSAVLDLLLIPREISA